MGEQEDIRKIIQDLVGKGISPSRARRIAMKKVKLKKMDKLGETLDELEKLDSVLETMGEDDGPT